MSNKDLKKDLKRINSEINNEKENSLNNISQINKTLKIKKVINVLNWKDLELWIKHPSLIHRHLGDKINEVIILMAYLGLRVTEAIKFDWKNQITVDSTIGFKILGKNNKERIVFNVFNNDYIKTKTLLFKRDKKLDNKEFSISRISIYNYLKTKAKKLNFSWNPTPHDFRRSFASRLISEKNVNPIIIKELLGHSFLITTERYIRKDPRLLAYYLKKEGLIE